MNKFQTPRLCPDNRSSTVSDCADCRESPNRPQCVVFYRSETLPLARRDAAVWVRVANQRTVPLSRGRWMVEFYGDRDGIWVHHHHPAKFTPLEVLRFPCMSRNIELLLLWVFALVWTRTICVQTQRRSIPQFLKWLFWCKIDCLPILPSVAYLAYQGLSRKIHFESWNISPFLWYINHTLSRCGPAITSKFPRPNASPYSFAPF